MADIEEHMAQSDDMEARHSKLKNKIDQRILDLFWTLADVNENIRASSAFNLITSLKSVDTITDADNTGIEVKYSLERLIAGLSSSRKAARLGFYVALVELLKTFNVIKVEDILSLIKSRLIITGSKQEKRGTVIGLCLAYGALIRSGKAYEKKKLLGEIVKELLNLIEEKAYVELIVGTLIEQLFLNVKESTFKKHIFPELSEILEKGWVNCTPSRLWILLLCMKFFPNIVTSDFLSSYWKEPVLICTRNFPDISRIVTQSTWIHPNVHPVCILLVEAALRYDEFSNFWSSIVTDVLLQNQKEKIYLAFELVKEFLPKLSTSEQIKTVLSSQMMREFMHNLAHANVILHSASHLLATSLVSNLKNTKDPSLQFTIVKQLITEPGSILFDRITNTKTVSSMLFHLEANALKQLADYLMDFAIGENIPSGVDSREVDSRRAYGARLLTLLIRNVNVLTDFEWKTRILQFFCLHAFFDINDPDPELLEGFKKPRKINGNLHAIFKECFFNLLDSVISMTNNKWLPNAQDHFNMLYSVIKFANNLLSSLSIEPVQEFEDNELEAWNTMLKTVKKLRSRARKDGKEAESHLFQILFLQMGLQLLANPKQSVNILLELKICCSKALKQRSKGVVENIDGSSEETEPHWVEVIVDILISFLSQNRKWLRSVSKSIFILLQPHLTVSAVCQILRVIDPDRNTDDDDPLVSEEDPDFNSSSTEDESAESEEEKQDVNENLKTALRVAMNDDGDLSEKDVDEMDEQAMLRLDLALAEAFKNQGHKTKKDLAHQKELLMHFRIRCLDLIEIIIKVRPVLKILSALLIPLVNALDFSIRSKDQQIFYSRTRLTLRYLLEVKRKEIQVDEFITEEDMQGFLEVLQQLFIKVQRVTNPDVAKTIANCCAFLVSGLRLLKLRKKDSNIRTPKKAYKKLLNSVITLYKESMDQFFMFCTYNLHRNMFISFMQKNPDLAWNFSDLLLKYGFKDDVRLFRKSQALNMLTNSLLKNQEVKRLITADQWSDFCKIFQQQFIPAVNELAAAYECVKPLYATELFQLFDTVVRYDRKSFNMLEEQLPAATAIQKLYLKISNKNLKKITRSILRSFNLNVPAIEIPNFDNQIDSKDSVLVRTKELLMTIVKKDLKRTTFSERTQDDDVGDNISLNGKLEKVGNLDDENLSLKNRKRKFNSESTDGNIGISNGHVSMDVDEVVKKKKAS